MTGVLGYVLHDPEAFAVKQHVVRELAVPGEIATVGVPPVCQAQVAFTFIVREVCIDLMKPALGERQGFNHRKGGSVAAHHHHQFAGFGLLPLHCGPAGRGFRAGQDERGQFISEGRAVAEGEGFEALPVHRDPRVSPGSVAGWRGIRNV